jgi:chemotaxis protein MotB
MLDLQRATDARLAALQSQAATRSEQAAALAAQVAELQRAVASRDAEVSRLSAQLAHGPDVDMLARDQLATASEDAILALNKQLDSLGAQLTEARAAASDAARLEASLAAAERGRADAEERLAAALRANDATARDVTALREELRRLELRQARAGAAAAGEVDSALAQVRWQNQLQSRFQQLVLVLLVHLAGREGVGLYCEGKCPLCCANLICVCTCVYVCVCAHACRSLSCARSCWPPEHAPMPCALS